MFTVFVEASTGFRVEAAIHFPHSGGIFLLLLHIIPVHLVFRPGATDAEAVHAHRLVEVVAVPEIGRHQLERTVADRAVHIVIRQFFNDFTSQKEAREGTADGFIHQLRRFNHTGFVIRAHEFPVHESAIFIHHLRRVEGKSTFRMRLHILYLALQLIIVAPVVIAIRQRDVLSDCAREIKGTRDVRDALAVLILHPENRLDDVRIALLIGPDHLLRPVRRGVVMDEDLDAELPALPEDVIQAGADILSMVIGHDTHRNQDVIYWIKRHSPTVL